MRDQVLALLAGGPMKTLAIRKALGITAGEAARELSAELQKLRRAGLVDLVAEKTWGLT